MLVPDKTSFADAEVNNAFFGIVAEHQQPRVAGRVPRHERPGRRHRQRRGGAERHVPAAVLDEPGRTAAPVPGPHQHQDPGAGAGHPAGRRADAACSGWSSSVRSGTISSLVNFGALTELPAAAPVGHVLLRRAPAVEEHLPALDRAGPRLPHHRLRALERRAGGQDRRRHLAGRRRSACCSTTPHGHRHPARARRRPVHRRRPDAQLPRRHAHDRPPAVQGPGHRRLLRHARARPADHAGHRRADHASRPTTSPTPRWSSSATCRR